MGDTQAYSGSGTQYSGSGTTSTTTTNTTTTATNGGTVTTPSTGTTNTSSPSTPSYRSGSNASDGSILPTFAGAGVATTSYDQTSGQITGYGRIIVYWLDQYGAYEMNQWCVLNQGDSAPNNATFVIPPTIPSGKMAVFTPTGTNGLGTWVLVSDNRGTTVYSTTDGSPTVWQKPGDIPAGYTTTPRPSSTSVWDTNSGQWIASAAALKAAAKTALTNAQANIALAQQQGLTIGPKYTAYEQALSAIAWGTDTTSTTLPTQPDSPTE